MLERMKAKDNFAKYTFGECCVFVLMILGAAVTPFGGMVFCAFAIMERSFQPLMWLVPCGAIALVCYGGLMYVTGSEGMD